MLIASVRTLSFEGTEKIRGKLYRLEGWMEERTTWMQTIVDSGLRLFRYLSSSRSYGVRKECKRMNLSRHLQLSVGFGYHEVQNTPGYK